MAVYDSATGALVASKKVENRLWVAEFMNSTTMYSLYSFGDTSTDINRRNGVWMWNIETGAEHRVMLRGAPPPPHHPLLEGGFSFSGVHASKRGYRFSGT